MLKRFSRFAVIGGVAAISLGSGQRAAMAQDATSLQVGAQIPVFRFSEFDSTDVGIGGRASWHLSPWIGVEGEVNFYPNDIPDDRAATSSSRVEGLFGITAGPRINRWRPFAKIRPGFLRVGASPGPIVCIQIFPPPLSCGLAAGETLFALDVGAGVELNTSDRTFVRFDIGDEMLRFSGPALDHDNQVHDDNFVRHDIRVSFGGGWRF